jgi:hypothetical protein
MKLLSQSRNYSVEVGLSRSSAAELLLDRKPCHSGQGALYLALWCCGCLW